MGLLQILFLCIYFSFKKFALRNAKHFFFKEEPYPCPRSNFLAKSLCYDSGKKEEGEDWKETSFLNV